MMRKIYLLVLLPFFSLQVFGQIGIGTPDPDYTLDVNGNMGINDFIYHNDDGDDTWMGFPEGNKWELVLGNKQMLFGDGGNHKLTINQNMDDVEFIVVADGIEHLIHAKTSTNRVGIGKTNPDFLLDVNGAMGISDFIHHAGNASSKFGFPANNIWEVNMNNTQMIHADGAAKDVLINPANGGVDFIIVADGIEHLLHAKTNDYKLGIGTSSPDYLLDVAGPMGIDDYIIHNDDADTKFGFPSNDTWQLDVAGKAMVKADGASKELIINPNNDNVDFIILADGIEHLIKVDAYNKLIGIGTATPAYFVDVEGDFRVIGDAIDHLIFADASNGRVGIGTGSPTVELEVAGEIKADGLTIGSTSGTSFQSLQSGSLVVSTNSISGEAIFISITFPNGGFTAVPLMIASPLNLNGPNNNSFAVTITSISQTGAILNIDKVTDDDGWTDDIQINWMAWE